MGGGERAEYPTAGGGLEGSGGACVHQRGGPLRMPALGRRRACRRLQGEEDGFVAAPALSLARKNDGQFVQEAGTPALPQETRLSHETNAGQFVKERRPLLQETRPSQETIAGQSVKERRPSHHKPGPRPRRNDGPLTTNPGPLTRRNDGPFTRNAGCDLSTYQRRLRNRQRTHTNEVG